MRTTLIILALLVFGCKTRRVETKVVEKTKDSVVYRVETVKAPIITDVISIPEICKDSVATQFERVFVRDTDTITISVRDNSLVATLRQTEKVLSEREQQLQLREAEVRELRNTTKYRTHWGLVLGFALAGFVIGFIRPWRLL